MTFERALIAICGLGLSVGPAAAQEVPNWPAPPIWSGAEEISDSAAKLGIHTLPLPFVGTNPCRIADTRDAGFPGAYGPPSLAAGVPRNFPLAGQCGIPLSAGAMSLNITVTNTLGPGFILIYPQGGAQPVVSTLNYIAGQTVANAAIVPLGTGGGVTVIAGVSGTDLIIDTNGYYGGSVQASVTGSCNPGSSIRVINADGSVLCEPDDNTTYSAGTGLSLSSGVFSLNTGFTDGSYWRLDGSAPAPGSFLGTTNNLALDFRVNGARAFRLEPNITSPNVVGGYSGNSATAGVYGGTISGGGSGTGGANRVTDSGGTVGGGGNNQAGDGIGGTLTAGAATVGGGDSNTASGAQSTIGGGAFNTASALVATVGGGQSNDATQTACTVAGGFGNTASGADAAVGGGLNNLASGLQAVVPGGVLNEAVGIRSFAAGRRAKANHDGAFVWADDSSADIASTGVNQFIVRASGGLWLGTTSSPSVPVTDFLNTSTGAHLTTGGIWTNNSDRSVKENFEPVDGLEILARVAELPISTWSYRAEPASIRHLGPMAQDFQAAFELGSDGRSIGTLDADGVALAAIQGLRQLLLEKEGQIRALTARIDALESERR